MPVTDRLDPDEIQANLRTKTIGREIVVYQSTASTNDIAAEYARNKENNGIVIFAEEQTAGRGRGGNKWSSGVGDSLLCSIVLTCSELCAEVVSLTSAVAVAEAVGGEARIKWPNDILFGVKKVAGILIESSNYGGRVNYVIGVGINCHQKKADFPAELRDIATSIDIKSKVVSDRISLSRRLLTSFECWLRTAVVDSDKVKRRWQSLSIQVGHRVTVIFDGREFTGNCIGIDPEKGLILQLERGAVRIFDAGHTSVVK